MDIESLNLEGQRTLGLEAEDVCLRRIREIERQSDPRDPALHRLLREVVVEEHGRREELAHGGRCLPSSGDSEADVALADFFPSAHERLGEAPLDRDAAMYYVESIKEEASRFFRRMAQAAMDDETREIFTHLALGELGEVARLRTVLL